MDSDKATGIQLGVNVPLGAALTVSGGFASLKTKFSTGGDSKHSGFGLVAKYDVSSGKYGSGFFFYCSGKIDPTQPPLDLWNVKFCTFLRSA